MGVILQLHKTLNNSVPKNSNIFELNNSNKALSLVTGQSRYQCVVTDTKINDEGEIQLTIKINDSFREITGAA